MRKKDLIAENKRLKDEVEDLKRQLTYAKTQIDIKDICLMLNKEREVSCYVFVLVLSRS